MADRLQEFGFRDSLYLRPTQEWVCGHLAEGCPCQIGPDSKGNCRATFECRPRRDGDRWICSRSQFAGGTCQEGPLPDGTCCREITKCQPVRSWRAKRGATAKWVAAVTVALILIVVAGVGRSWFLNPGALTTKHAELGTCATCHTAFDKGPAGWLHAAFATSATVADSDNCMQCHRLGDNPLSAHGMAPTALAELTEVAAQAPASSGSLVIKASNALFPRVNEGGAPLPCATCHREHHGVDWQLTQMSNERCASCHQSQFVSFADGHPPFSGYPYDRRTRIVFDHTSHIDKHFKEQQSLAKAPKQCRDCHDPDGSGELMLVKPFEQVCAACHGGQVAGDGRAGAKGIAVLSAPGLDVAGLRDHDAAIGEWPEFSEAPVTSFMDFLLAQDEAYVSARKTLDGVDLLDLSDASEDQLAAIEQLAWSVKSLLFELRTRGASALQEQLELAFGRPLSSTELTDLAALLPTDALAAAQTAWFPALLTEVPRHRAGERILLPGLPEEEAAGEQPADSAVTDSGDGSILGGDDSSGSILGDSSDSSGSILGDSSGGSDSILGGDSGSSDSILGDASGGSDSILGDVEDKADSILGAVADKVDSILGGGDSILGDSAGGGDSILGGDEGKDDSILGGGLTGGDDSDRAVEQAELPEPAPVEEPEDWMAGGGWYRDYFVLRHRPVGHADGFIRAWVNHTAAVSGDAPAAAAIFEELVADNAVGVCGKCHSVDASDGAAPAMNWHARRPVANTRGFTRFSHTSHFSLMDETGCLNCHKRDPAAAYEASFKDRDASTYTSNFTTIDQSFCATCHTPEKAGDTCLTCHNYHVGSFPPTVLGTQIVVAPVPETMAHKE